MKKLLLALFSLAAITTQAQTAEDIVQKYTANMGGLEAFNKVKTLKMSGSFSTQGMDFPLTVELINGKAVRTDVEAMGQTITSAYNNGTGWRVNPLQGASAPTTVTGSELGDLKAQASIASQLMDYKARGNKIELLGEETIDGVKTNKIKLTNKDDGKETTYFINAQTNVLVKSVSSKEMQGQQVDVSTFYSDLKEFDGIKFFMTRSMQMNGEEFQAIVINKIELNVPVAEGVFAMP